MLSFPRATQLRCFRHLQQDVEGHLKDNHFPDTAVKEYIHDLFGWQESDGTVHEGLVDSCNAEQFNKNLRLLADKWNSLEKTTFTDQKHTSPTFIVSLLNKKQKYREDVGLGCPPWAFYTNANESVNALLQDCIAYKKQQWPVLNGKIKKAVDDHQHEMEKAIIGQG